MCSNNAKKTTTINLLTLLDGGMGLDSTTFLEFAKFHLMSIFRVCLTFKFIRIIYKISMVLDAPVNLCWPNKEVCQRCLLIIFWFLILWSVLQFSFKTLINHQLQSFEARALYFQCVIFMLQLEASRPRLVGQSVCRKVGRSVFKTRFAMNQPCLQNKICFQCEGDISPQHKETKKQKQ